MYIKFIKNRGAAIKKWALFNIGKTISREKTEYKNNAIIWSLFSSTNGLDKTLFFLKII